jgi:mRNA (2'-O-methyladenosine-N6-)-methyltransferase
MSDAWEEIQAIKSKRLSLREKLQKRKKERQELLSSSVAPIVPGKMSIINLFFYYGTVA